MGKNIAKEFVLITSVGTDRPGIVEELSGWILQQGGNIEDSRMSLLGGEFATIVLVSGVEGLSGKLEETSTEFAEKANLTLFTKPVSRSSTLSEEPSLRYILKATSLDNAGIIHQAASILRPFEINIVSASTQTTSAPFSGAPVFQFKMVVDIPSSVPMGKLRENLQELGDRMNIDFTLNATD
jgi:glycine cleavage system transcriptional repressor